MFVSPSDQKNQADPRADGRVGDIKRRKTNLAAAPLLHVKIEEVHDRMAPGEQPVGQISSDPAKNQSKGNLARKRMRVEMMSGQKQHHKRHQRHQGQHAVIAAKEAPGGTGIAPMHKPEKTGDDDLFITKFERAQDQPFGGLVERKHHQRHDCDAAVGFAGI